MSDEDLKFEEAMEKLADIVENLESGGLSLEESLDKFTEGMELLKFCNTELNSAEEKIEIVLKDKEDIDRALFDEEDIT
ncbi:MAG: exodeoxyribonuclease VII small subunit [Halothermotrichaceae bacterium]